VQFVRGETARRVITRAVYLSCASSTTLSTKKGKIKERGRACLEYLSYITNFTLIDNNFQGVISLEACAVIS